MISHNEMKNQLLEALNEVMEKGQWHSSLFLRNILKQLQELHMQVTHEFTEVDEEEREEAITNNLQQRQALAEEREGYQRAYITLYQAYSDQLDRWFTAIKMLDKYSASRAAYHSVQDVENMIRQKQSKCDAYVIVWVKETDILPVGEAGVLKDRWGYELMTLKEGSFSLKNVIEFVHDGKHYCLTGQGLVLN